jgi:hypothetical protein
MTGWGSEVGALNDIKRNATSEVNADGCPEGGEASGAIHPHGMMCYLLLRPALEPAL